jgi:uncharacterized protein
VQIGVGLGYRTVIRDSILKYKSKIDWLEFIPDLYINKEEEFEEIKSLSNEFPLCPHSLNMSLGSESGADSNYVMEIEKMCAIVDAPWASDHLCFTHVPHSEVPLLTPMERTEETLEIVINNIQNVKKIMRRPFICENITYYFDIPTSSMEEHEFLNKVITEADCGLLLDVTNVFINSMNHKFDPYKYLDSILLDRVVEIHISGGFENNGKWYDSHSKRVNKEVWELLDYIIPKTPVKGILLEIDAEFPEDFNEVIIELEIARSILNKHHKIHGAMLL